MRRLTRKTLYTQNESDNVRLNQLERRIPVDYPHWGSALLQQVVNANNEGDAFTFTFPDECTPNPVECEDTFTTDGDYLLFPTGHDGPFHVYMTVPITGGFSDVDDAYVATDTGANTPSKRFSIGVEQEIWRDNAPFGYITTWGFRSTGERLAGDSEDGLGDGREFWLHWIGTGAGIFQPDRDRRALRFTWDWRKAANISFIGVACVALDPPDQGIAGIG